MTDEVAGEIVPSSAILPAHGGLSALARQALAAGVPPATRRAYERDWAEFATWCDREGREPMPASAETMTEYASYLCYKRPVCDRSGLPVPGAVGLAPASAKRMLRTVSAMHMHLDQPAPRLAQANLVLKGYEKKLADDRDPRAKPRKATAVSPAILAELTGRGLQGAQELTRLRDTAMLYLNYGAAMRASELVRVNIEDVTEEERGMVVAIYRVKTRQHADARIPAEDSPVTVAAIKKWIAVLAAHGRTSGPLFPVICKHGEWGNGHCGPHGEDRMTERSAGRRVRLAAQEAGLEGRFTIHSGRRGFATEAAHAGHGMLAIARHGRAWSDNSRSLQGYIDDAATWTMNPLKGAGA